jgi:hypothetical protein
MRAALHHLAHPVSAAALVAASMGWDRVLVALAAVAGVTVLTLADKVDGAAAVGVYSAVIGYVLGRASVVPEPERKET